MITQEEVKELFEYKDGGLYWKISRTNSLKVGDRYGCLKPDGIRQGSVNNIPMLEHRLIFLYHHGYLPQFIDHINGDRSNSRIENIRPASREENNRNTKKRVNNVSGHKGVFWNKKSSKWQVQVRHQKKAIHLGMYDDFELACLVADEGRSKYHGAFVRN